MSQEGRARKALLVSIHPRYAVRILKGGKTVELRRIRPRVHGETILLIYVSSPVKALKAIARVERITAAKPDKLWEQVAHCAGLSQAEFKSYFSNVNIGYAIHLKEVWQLPQPILLSELRELWPGFRPPQSYKYLSDNETSKLIKILGSSGVI